jgi:hypothetical protein
VQELWRRELLMPLPTIGYGLLPFVLLPFVHLSVSTSYVSVVKASAGLREKLYCLTPRGPHRAFRVGETASRAPPGGYSPKYENEPEKCFIINKSAQKRT